MKQISKTILFTLSIAALCVHALEASTLKVYNMYDRPWMCKTYPLAPCEHGRDECSVFPYQSIFNSQSKTFKLPNRGIQKLYFKGIIGPRFCITLDLHEDEHATIELYGNGAYKYNGNMLYAELLS